MRRLLTSSASASGCAREYQPGKQEVWALSEAGGVAGVGDWWGGGGEGALCWSSKSPHFHISRFPAESDFKR